MAPSYSAPAALSNSPAAGIHNQVNIVSGVSTPLTTEGDVQSPLVTPFISARIKLRGL